MPRIGTEVAALGRYAPAGAKVHADDTPVPVPVPVLDHTTIVRPAPAWYRYTSNRTGKRPQQHLQDFHGILQVDPYGGNGCQPSRKSPRPSTDRSNGGRRSRATVMTVASRSITTRANAPRRFTVWWRRPNSTGSTRKPESRPHARRRPSRRQHRRATALELRLRSAGASGSRRRRQRRRPNWNATWHKTTSRRA